MQVSNYIFIAALEVYLALILISLFLLFHSRTQKRLIRRQQTKLQELLHLQKAEHNKPTTATPTLTNNYKAHLAQQLIDTINHFHTLSADGNISSPQPLDSPIPQKVAALRYQFLHAEDSASYEKDNTLAIDWTILEQCLTPLNAPETATYDCGEELAISKKRIENLERFKQLFFDMEKQWQEAQQKAQKYHAQLSEMSEAVADKECFNDILDSYYNVYHEVNESIKLGRQGLGLGGTSAANKITHPEKSHSNAAGEIIKLRNVAADQHRIITQLQRRLENAKTAAEKEGAITELQQQLHRQTRFVQESETCIKLLEDELAKSHEKLIHQEQQLENVEELEEENKRIKKALSNFVVESKALMTTIIQLEHDKASLQANPRATLQGAEKERVKKLQTDFLVLQTRYAELEEKYLDLKSGR